MSGESRPPERVAIACGGTGGHLFPGLAIAEELKRRQADVTLFVSPKEVDQKAVEGLAGLEVVTIPAVGFSRGNVFGFVRGFTRSYHVVQERFKTRPPQAALAMGGFTSAPPLIAARRLGARTFLHESNTIPGRANRWLSWIVEKAFVSFSDTARRLHTKQVALTGTPVRPQFVPRDPASCRWALGLDPARPVVIVMGGSQGATGINRRLIESLPLFAQSAPELQWVHLSGSNDYESVKQAYAGFNLAAVVFPSFREMDLALGAATVALSRAGASSLAELAAVRLPSVLIPYPAATDNHQLQNARAFQEGGAARLLPQAEAAPERLCELVLELVRNKAARAVMQRSLGAWHRPHAAEEIADSMLGRLRGAPAQAQFNGGKTGVAPPGSERDVERTGFTVATNPGAAGVCGKEAGVAA